MFSTLGMLHSKLAKESHVFGHFFDMNSKKLVMHHPLEIMSMEWYEAINVLWVDTK